MSDEPDVTIHDTGTGFSITHGDGSGPVRFYDTETGATQEFESVEAYYEHLRRDEESAFANATDDQLNLLVNGGYYRREMAGLMRGLVIYGRVRTAEEILDTERGYGADEDELAWQRERLNAFRKRGLVDVEAFSEVVPDGELGSEYVANVEPISKWTFERARRHGWKLEEPA